MVCILSQIIISLLTSNVDGVKFISISDEFAVDVRLPQLVPCSTLLLFYFLFFYLSL